MKEVCVTIIIPKETDDAIERIARVKGMLKRAVVCEALNQYVKKTVAKSV